MLNVSLWFVSLFEVLVQLLLLPHYCFTVDAKLNLSRYSTQISESLFYHLYLKYNSWRICPSAYKCVHIIRQTVALCLAAGFVWRFLWDSCLWPPWCSTKHKWYCSELSGRHCLLKQNQRAFYAWKHTLKHIKAALRHNAVLHCIIRPPSKRPNCIMENVWKKM